VSIAITLAWISTASAQIVDTTLWVTTGTVNTVVRDGNTIYIGGNFKSVGPATGGGAPLSIATGALVRPFPKVLGTVYAVAADGSGGWYIGGSFTQVGNATRSNIAHVLANGSVASWNPNANDQVLALATNGSVVYAGGRFQAIGGQYRTCIAALDAVSGSAINWSPRIVGNSHPHVSTLAVSGARVFAGGVFDSVGTEARNNLAAVDVNSGAVSAWNPHAGGGFDLGVMALAPHGSTLYVAGSFAQMGGQTRRNVAQLDTTAGNATGWDPNIDYQVYALAVQGTTIYVGGAFTTVGVTPRSSIAAVDSTTGTATDWSPVLTAQYDWWVYALAVSGNTIFAGGGFTNVNGAPRSYIAAIDATTGAPTSWSADAGNWVYALAASGSTLYVGGSFTTMGGKARVGIAALDAATGTATDWNPNAGGVSSDVWAIAPRGNIVYVGGDFSSIGGQARNTIAALDATTGAATAWNPNTDGIVQVIVPHGDTIFVGGSFTHVGGQLRGNIAALDSASGGVLSWNPNADRRSYGVKTMTVSGNRIYVGGDFSQIGGQAREGIAALNINDGTATGWNPGLTGTYLYPTVYAITVNGNRVYVGGDFYLGGQLDLAAVDPTTGAAVPWYPIAYGTVRALAVSADGGTVYAGGDFSANHDRLDAYDAGTGAETIWDPEPDGSVYSLALDGATVYAAGSFTRIGGRPQSALAAMTDVTTEALVSLIRADGLVDRIELAWQLGRSIGGSSVSIDRREEQGAWRDLGTIVPRDDGRVVYTDHDVTRGTRYAYRLRRPGTDAILGGETWVRVPDRAILSLAGSRPNPSFGPLRISFSIPSAAPATLELLDVSGRRILVREVGSMGAGNHVVALNTERPLAAGLYVLRLTQQGKALIAKALVIR
jgi:hypothetical protein